MQGAFSTSGTTDLDEASHWLQYLGTAGMAAELAPNPVVKRSGKVVANLSFAVSSGLNIYQKWSQGFNSFSDWTENGLDLLVLALTLAGLKKETSEIFAKAGVKNAEALLEAGEEVVVSGKKWTALAKFEVGVGFGMIAVCHGMALDALLEIQRRKDLTPAQKVDQMLDVLELLVIQDLIMIVTHTKKVLESVKPETSSGTGEKAPESGRNLDEFPGKTGGERHETKVSRKRAKERPDPGMQADEGAIPEKRSFEETAAHENELIKNQAERSLDRMLQDAELAKIEIDVIADNLAQKFGGRVAKAPLKTKESSMRKIMNEYGGRASDMKDLARNTIIVPRSEIEQVAAELDKICIRVKRVVPDETGMGYSGINATYKSANGMLAEI